MNRSDPDIFVLLYAILFHYAISYFSVTLFETSLKHLAFVCQESLSQETFTKNILFREVRSYCWLKGSGLR